MTAPRRLLRGSTYLISHRTLFGAFLLRPGEVVNQAFAYILALAAQRYGIQLHAYCVLSNHFHLVVTDPDARLPAFQQFLDGLVARALNASLGRDDAFWSSRPYSAVLLGSPEDVVRKAAYALANPVAAGLVPAGHLWPGLWSGIDLIGTTISVRRPARFFSAKGGLPKTVDLTLAVPPGFEFASVFKDQLRAELSRQEQAARADNASFLGTAKILAQSPFDRPKRPTHGGGINPRIAARDKWRRVELLQRLKTFLADYQTALEIWREGKVDPVFPAGTYLMRVAHGVVCAPA